MDEQKKDLTIRQMQEQLLLLRLEVDAMREELKMIKGDSQFLNDPLMDSAAVCQFLCISYRQLKNYKSRGDITALRNGSKCLYRTSEVRRFIDEVLMVKGRKTKALLEKHIK